jgi:arylmalonate decarboxylase
VKRIGYVSPDSLVGNGPYEFYRLAPDNVMMLYATVGVYELDASTVERAYEPIDDIMRELRARKVDLVVQGGVPLPLATGRAFHDRLLARMTEVAEAPATSTVECVVDALRGLGLRRVVVANKWSEPLNRCLADEFFGPAGIAVAGVSTQVMAPTEFRRMSSEDNLDLAYELGRAGLAAQPDADGLYIGGGSWLATKIVPRLEDEFGKPVVTNSLACAWSLCRRLGEWQPRPGFGTLIATA